MPAKVGTGVPILEINQFQIPPEYRRIQALS